MRWQSWLPSGTCAEVSDSKGGSAGAFIAEQRSVRHGSFGRTRNCRQPGPDVKTALRERNFDLSFLEHLPSLQLDVASHIGNALLGVGDPEPDLQIGIGVMVTPTGIDRRRMCPRRSNAHFAELHIHSADPNHYTAIVLRVTESVRHVCARKGEVRSSADLHNGIEIY